MKVSKPSAVAGNIVGMNGYTFIGTLNPTAASRAGRMLAAGRLTATVTSRKTNQHVTLRFAACKRVETGPRRWPTVAFTEATHVFVKDLDGASLATYRPQDGVIKFERAATVAARWAIAGVLRHLTGTWPRFDKQAELAEQDACGMCGRALTDPESLERGIGPDCYGKATGSKPVRAAVAV